MSIYRDNDKSNCCGCGACVNICPRDAISMQLDEYGFAYPHIDQASCLECNLCFRACEKVNKNEGNMPLKAFAASHRNKQILQTSSSGGVFSALAEYFVNNGGAVCGCVFDAELNAVHICTEKETDLLRIRKSKYVQSDVGLIYRDIQKRLKQGQLVLFTGTPCQVAALYAVVGRSYENLTTVDLICHGVPSQRLFDKFIRYLEKRYKTQIVSFDFRSKRFGWPRFTMEFTNSHQRTINIGKEREFYIPSFTGGNIIRQSCLSCKYACANRIGDITIGDLWGYEQLNLSFNTLGGTSLFTINTPNSAKWLDVLLEKLTCEEIDYTLAVQKNTCLRHPTPEGKKRDLYMQALKNDRIEDIALKYRRNKKKTIFRERIKLIIPAALFTRIRKRKSR